MTELTWNNLTQWEQWILNDLARGEKMVYSALPTKRLQDNGLIAFVEYFEAEHLVHWELTTTGRAIVPNSEGSAINE